MSQCVSTPVLVCSERSGIPLCGCIAKESQLMSSQECVYLCVQMTEHCVCMWNLCNLLIAFMCVLYICMLVACRL